MIGQTISDYRTEEKRGSAMAVVYKVVLYKLKDTFRGRVVARGFHPKQSFRTARRRL
jgi:hypothetical protein